MNKVYQLEFGEGQAVLAVFDHRAPRHAFYGLGNTNHDLAALTYFVNEMNHAGEEVVSVVQSGMSGDGIRPRFLIVTKVVQAAKQANEPVEKSTRVYPDPGCSFWR